MRSWRHTAEVSGRQSTQIALRLIDDVTARGPIGSVSLALEAEEAPNEWRDTQRRGIFGASGVVTFPGLERRRNAGSLPARRYRVLVRAPFYRPLYPTPGGLEFLVQPHDDDTPAPLPPAPTPLVLLPAPTYPFPSHMRVLRGRVKLGGSSDYVADAVVHLGMVERTLSDERGAYALPLRWAAFAGALTIDAAGPAGEAGARAVVLPADLAVSITIDIA